MKNGFSGFSPEGIAFLRDLKRNNDREWFTPRKQVFEERVRLPMIELVRAIHAEMLRFAPDYVGDAAKSVFRIYRDTRFSKNKTPYKTHVAASFRHARAGKAHSGFYFSVSPEEIEIGGGLYRPEPNALLAVRQRIADRHGDFRKTFEPLKIRKLMGELYGESAARAPKGFDPKHPAIELLKRKQYCLFVTLDAAIGTTPKLFGEIVKRFEAITPFVNFLNAPLMGSERGRDFEDDPKH
ncbi:MAG TPA: DUF2461 domain-containing protein [Bryobacteraceae bacterium]|nr:DUF2461 domain-containing protein [Bryobacteraceae bacterium]